jgi:hypothetical protein
MGLEEQSFMPRRIDWRLSGVDRELEVLRAAGYQRPFAAPGMAV